MSTNPARIAKPANIESKRGYETHDERKGAFGEHEKVHEWNPETVSAVTSVSEKLRLLHSQV